MKRKCVGYCVMKSPNSSFVFGGTRMLLFHILLHALTCLMRITHKLPHNELMVKHLPESHPKFSPFPRLGPQDTLGDPRGDPSGLFPGPWGPQG